MNHDPVRGEEPGHQMEAEPGDLLKVKSKLKRAGKIHMGDGREACDLDLPVSMSAGDALFTFSLRLSAGPRTESSRRD